MRNKKKAGEAGVDRMMGRVIAGEDREGTGPDGVGEPLWSQPGQIQKENRRMQDEVSKHSSMYGTLGNPLNWERILGLGTV